MDKAVLAVVAGVELGSLPGGMQPRTDWDGSGTISGSPLSDLRSTLAGSPDQHDR